MKEYVMDTSVVIKWFSEHNETDITNALAIRNEILESKISLIVPSLLFYELANALRYNNKFTVNDVKNAVKSVIDMGFNVKTVTNDLIKRAIEIAFEFNITVYDSCFLVLSQIEKKNLITADYKFIERVKSFKNITKLSEFR